MDQPIRSANTASRFCNRSGESDSAITGSFDSGGRWVRRGSIRQIGEFDNL